MDNKLTTADIADILEKKSEFSAREVDRFIKDAFSLAGEVISRGESLTIKGIGTFAPVWVSPRQSVDVNTKVPIQIPGHYKISFTPDKSLSDAVNEPFASFTTEIIPNPSKEEGTIVQPEQAERIENSVDETDLVTEKEKPQSALPLITQTKEEKTNNEVPTAKEEIIEDSTFDDYYTKLEYKRHTRNGYIAGFCTALLLIVIAAFLWYWTGKENGKNYALVFSPFKVAVKDDKVDISENKSDINVVNKVDSVKEALQDSVIEDTIERGKFLTTIAKKHYGNKIFWVYIYRENQSRIWNPRDLPKGFKVIIPAASKYEIDANSRESIKRAEELERQILYEIE